jgi:hypothetical protein
MEFGILGSDDGLPGFSGWERKLGYGLGPSICLLTYGLELNIGNG